MEAGRRKGADMATLWLGLDIGKTTFVAAAMKGQEALELGEYVNDTVGCVALAEAVRADISASTIVHLVLEPTGGYEQVAVAFGYEQGWQVSLPNPKQVRDWAKGTGRRAKTDREDAKLLARYGAACRPAPHPPLAQEVNELDSLLKRRQDLEQMLQQEHNRLEQLSGRPGIAGAVVPSLEEMINSLEEALENVNQAIDNHLDQYERLRHELKRLLALPGIGEKVGLPLLVLLHRWQTLTSGEGTAKGLTAYVGLDPQPHESGRSVHKRATISKMGDVEVRRLLYMGALSAVHGRNPLHHFYERLVERGKAKKLAVVAAARKILVWAWTLFSREVDWNPELHSI
jgi:transposase